MKLFNNHNHHQPYDEKRNQSLQQRLRERLSHIRRKMSRGAANIFRMMRTRCHWGNKKLWGFKDKGGHGKRGGGE